jgi:hypothetical protein
VALPCVGSHVDSTQHFRSFLDAEGADENPAPRTARQVWQPAHLFHGLAQRDGAGMRQSHRIFGSLLLCLCFLSIYDTYDYAI